MLKAEQAKRERERAKQEELRKQAEEDARREREMAEKYDNSDPADVEKRLKKLRKKMRQVDALKERDRATLNADQLKKLDEEAKLFRLIAELEQLLARLK